MADEIIDQIEVDPGVKEFKRTFQHDDGSTVTLRIDITEVDAESFVVSIVRQRDEGARREVGPKTFARGDHRGLATWLGSESEA